GIRDRNVTGVQTCALPIWAQRLLMIPEYFNYLLTGKMVNEYTNASSTALVNAEKKTWDDELIAALGLPRKIFGELHMPGASVGGSEEGRVGGGGGGGGGGA